MHHLPTGGSRNLVAIENAALFSNTVQGKQFILVITDCFSKLSRAITTSKTTAVLATNVFSDH